MTTDEANKLHRSFVLAVAPEELVAVLDQMDATPEANGLAVGAELDLRLSALRNLRRLLPDDSNKAQNLIIRRLLPLCVQKRTEDFEADIALSQCRELAGEWLNGLRGAQTAATLQNALTFLVAHLDSAEAVLPTCWTLSEIGFRTPELVTRLFLLAEDADELVSDTALATLAALGLSGQERHQCLEQALSRSRHRISGALARALVAFPSSVLIFALSEAWLERSEAELAPVRDLLFALFIQIGAEIVEPDGIDQACSAIARLHERAPETLNRRLRLAGNALPHLNSPLATQLLLNLLPVETNATSYDRWLVMLRLEECCRPRQLVGFEAELAHERVLIDTLAAHILELGKSRGRDNTEEGKLKLAALRTALLIGAPDLLAWLGSALAQEANAYLRQEFLELYAALRLAPLPDPIPRWITEEKVLGREPADNIELMLRLAASRVARSAETDEAFDLLSRPGLTRDGMVMLETVEGLVSATLAIGENPAHRERVLNRLFDALASPSTRAQLSAACCAISAAAYRGWLTTEPWRERLLSTLETEPPIPLQPHDLARLVGAIAGLPRENLPVDFFERLALWGHEREDRLGARALEVLVNLGHFSEHADWIAPKLGLTRGDGGAWEWHANSPSQVEWGPLLIAELYAQAPLDFGRALCSVLKDERWFPNYDTAGALLRLVRAERTAIDEPIAAALVARARQRNSSRFADLSLFGQLAALVPERLACENWSVEWPNWLSEARVSLANALGALPDAVLSPEARRHAVGMLVSLARDGHFSVRRAALRALGRLLPEQLASLCAALSSESSSVEERSLAAEAWAWLKEGSEWRDRLAADANKRVRESVRAAAEARQRRDWANDYLGFLVSLDHPTNAEILRSWKYGNALSRVGDDETIEALRSHLENVDMASCMRFRLTGVLKEMEKRWEAVTKKWPQPMLSLPGNVETSAGTLRCGDRVFGVTCTLWHIGSVTVDVARRWGGVAEASDVGLEFVTVFNQSGILTLEDGRKGEIFVHGISSEARASFRGIGRYPVSEWGKL
jgi:hypothetical protein